MTMSLRLRQHGVLVIKCLNRGVLMHAKHNGVLRRVPVQAGHITGRGLEIRVIGSKVAFEPVRLDAVLGPNARHRQMRNVVAQLGRQLARRPAGGTINRRVLRRTRQHSGLQPLRHLVALTTGVPRGQVGQAISETRLLQGSMQLSLQSNLARISDQVPSADSKIGRA